MNQEDFSRQYDSYAKMLYQIAYVYFGNRQDAEEMVQEAFLKLCFHAPEFKNYEHEKAWLIRVLTNLCRNELKTVWKKRVDKEENMELYGQQQPEHRELLQLVVALPDTYKVPVYLFYYEGYSVKEIAAILRLSQSAVKMRLQRGREALKLELE